METGIIANNKYPITPRGLFVKRLLAITIVVSLLIICLAGFLLWKSKLNYEERAEITTQNLSLVLAGDIADAIDKIDLTVLTVADEVEKQLAGGSIDAQKLNALIARHHARLPVLDGLRVVNDQGENAYGTGVASGPRTSVADRSYFIRLRSNPDAGLVISEPVIGRVSNKWSLILARRVNRPDGSFAGLVYGTITMDQFFAIFSTVDVGKHGAVTLRDDELALIARHPEPEDFSKAVGRKNATLELQRSVKMGKNSGTFRATWNIDKTQRTISFQKVSNRPLYVIVGLAHEDYLATWRSEVAQVSGLVAFLVFVTFISAWGGYRGWMRRTVAAQDLARQEESLRESERNYREIFNAANDAVFIHDSNTGAILDVNESMLHLFGFSREEALRLHPDDTSLGRSPFSAVEARQWMAKSITEGPQVFEWHARKKGGDLFWVEVSLKSANISGQRRILAIVRDITGRKKAEAEREKLEAQLRQAHKMESVGRLAGGVAHDFNNMLGVILGHAEIALDQVAPSQPLHANLEEIRKAAQRSADLTRQLLAFARKQTIAPKILDLNDAVTGMLKLLPRLIGEDISLTWFPGADLRPIKIDPSQVDQIITNLCVNARDAIDGGGTISLETGNITFDEVDCSAQPGFVPGEYVFLAISDDGCGMDPETLAQVFEPFFTTKSIGKGTGLGLATVYGIVKQNNGFVYVSSEPGKGTTFKIFLPQMAAETIETTVSNKKEVSEGQGETVLLVEDEKSLRVICLRYLQALGYKVLQAETSTAALQLSEHYPDDIHLLLTDVVMPGMNGRQLAQRVCAAKPGVKVLFMSGYTADVIAQRGVLEHNMHFISKPFSRNELARKVRDVLAAGEAAKQNSDI